MSRRDFRRAASSGTAGRGRGPEGAIFSGPEEGTGDAQKEVKIQTSLGAARGILHAAEGARGAAVLVSGAGGGIEGPSGVYRELAERLRTDGVTTLRLDYRKPNDLSKCTHDVLATLDALARRGVERAILVGWSFGGAVVISAGATSERVVGVATVASQTYGTEDVDKLSPEKSLLLIHGTADQTLSAELSHHLYARAGEPKKLVLYPGGGHGIERYRSEMLERLHAWSRDLLLNHGGA